MLSRIPVIICIGSDKISGDCVGPLTGVALREKLNIKAFVYGTTENAVHGKNLAAYLAFIQSVHQNNPIIAVDACMSDCHRAGEIKVIKGGVHPQRALTRRKNPVGNLGVLAVVSKTSANPLSALMSVAIDDVEKLSNKVAFALKSALV